MNPQQAFDIDHFKKNEHYLKVINQFATVLLNAKTVDDVVWAVAKNAIAQLGYEDCVIYLVDEDNEYLIQRAAHGLKNPIDLDILNPIKIKIGEGIVGHVAITGKGEIVVDTSKDNRYIIDLSSRLSEITVPIIHNNKVIGVIDSEHPDKNFYPPDDLGILTTIASMTATKLIQAKYDEKIQEYQDDLKTLVHIKTMELNKTLSELKAQKLELTDSINYARRIQKAILRNPNAIKELFPESFIIYKPKDILAGDFYMAEKIDGKIILAVADCTGHGVPGAIISVVCHTAVKRAIRRVGLSNAAAILQETRKLIIETFEGSDEDIKDGMDIGFCILDPLNNTLDFSGANINLHYIQNSQLNIVKANRQPVGQHVNLLPFTNQIIQLQKGDSIYLFTDGLADQFGGPKGKKFKHKQLRDFLHHMQEFSTQDQYTHVKQTFENWKGNLAQVDDVCVMGVRL
jgi:serine phosphatase RsbU (regulator of sigma subunit)